MENAIVKTIWVLGAMYYVAKHNTWKGGNVKDLADVLQYKIKSESRYYKHVKDITDNEIEDILEHFLKMELYQEAQI